MENKLLILIVDDLKDNRLAIRIALNRTPILMITALIWFGIINL